VTAASAKSVNIRLANRVKLERLRRTDTMYSNHKWLHRWVAYLLSVGRSFMGSRPHHGLARFFSGEHLASEALLGMLAERASALCLSCSASLSFRRQNWHDFLQDDQTGVARTVSM
jgi:hypothetical protein